MIEGKLIAVWFSCGAASAVAAKLSIEKYTPSNTVRILNNPIAQEHEDNQRFLRDVQEWLHYDIAHVSSLKFPAQDCEEVWDERKFMSTFQSAPCTYELKAGARADWENVHHPDYTVLGFTAEEQKRADRFRKTERNTLLTPLVDAGFTKIDCFKVLKDAGITLPKIYSHGFPNANCIGCVKSMSPTYWNLVRREFPEVFAKRAEQSRRLGTKLVEVHRQFIFLDELDPNQKGGKLKDYTTECGIFCEERDVKGT